MVRSRLAASLLVFVLGGAMIVGCSSGSSSKSSTTSTRTTPSSTGSQKGVCSQAIQIIQPVSSAASTGNVDTIVQRAQSAIPKLQSQAQKNGVSAATQTAITDVANALQAVVNGARGPDSGMAITSAAVDLGNACAGS